MNSQPAFKAINLSSWSRKPYFDYYSRQVKCTYSITVTIEIESLLASCRERSIKLYPAMIYIVTTAINQVEELRMGYNEQGQLGIWNFRSPSYTIFHPDDKTFSNIWTGYHPLFSLFHHSYLQDIEQYGSVKSLFAKEGEPGNTFPISCIPWVNFTSFNLNIYDNGNYLCPIFTIGQYTKYDHKTVIPVAVQLHHAVCDGYQAGLLFDAIKKLAEEPELWIKN
jgi:chloramphenicol O-acetyltransferase type A